VTHLRKMMLEELQRRNYAQSTVDAYISAMQEFARYFDTPPDQLGPEHVRKFQLHLIRDRKLAANTVKQRMAAVQFFFIRTLKRPWPRQEFSYPKIPVRLPSILSQEEVTRLIDSAANLSHRAMLMTLYSTGLRRSELVHLKVEDIDSQRMTIHIRQGKRKKDRVVPLSPKLLETLREYWRKAKPRTYLFPGQSGDVPLTTKAVWHACRGAVRRAGIHKRALRRNVNG
jgi:integrase/recombinase XerD